MLARNAESLFWIGRYVERGGVDGPGGERMTWRLRIVHSTGYRYSAPVTQSYNEVRLTPRSDSRQNLMVGRLETTPATRSYRYTDYWGTTVTAFDLHAPHTELKVVSSSVVETADEVEPPDTTWTELRSQGVLDRYVELLGRTDYTAPTGS